MSVSKEWSNLIKNILAIKLLCNNNWWGKHKIITKENSNNYVGYKCRINFHFALKKSRSFKKSADLIMTGTTGIFCWSVLCKIKKLMKEKYTVGDKLRSGMSQIKKGPR